MKALIYCRVSSVRQVVEGHGLSSQEQRCRAYAGSRNYQVVKSFPDDGVSGGLFERPAMQELIHYLDSHPTDQFVIIFDDLARFARDLKVHLKLKTELVSRGARLESPNFTFEDSPEGEFIENVLASKAQLDRQQNRRQVIQKMKARLENGFWSFCPPPGLVSKKDAVHGRLLVPDEPIASILKTAIEGYRDRLLMTQSDVIEFLTNEYKKKGLNKKVSLHGVQEILSELLYTGYLEYPKWDVTRRKAAHEGFITIETFEEVQRILHDRSKPKPRRDTNPEFPLRGLVLCSLCQKPLTASFHHGHKGQLYPHYFCKTSGCILKDKSIHREKIESDFMTLLFGLQADQPVKDLATSVLTDVWEQHQEQCDDMQKSHQRQLHELSGSIESLTGRITKTTNETLIRTYEAQIMKLGKKKEELDSISYPTRYTSEQFGTATKKVLGVLENPVSMWQNGNLEDRLTVFFMHFDQKPAYDREKGFGTPTLAQSVNLIRSLGSDKKSMVEMPGIEPGSKRSPIKLLQA